MFKEEKELRRTVEGLFENGPAVNLKFFYTSDTGDRFIPSLRSMIEETTGETLVPIDSDKSDMIGSSNIDIETLESNITPNHADPTINKRINFDLKLYVYRQIHHLGVDYPPPVDEQPYGCALALVAQSGFPVGIPGAADDDDEPKAKEERGRRATYKSPTKYVTESVRLY
jgi:hypothetical protein